MMPHVDRRPTYNWGWHGSPKESFMTCYYYPNAMQPSARYLPPWLGWTRAITPTGYPPPHLLPPPT
jgi:hypothetical protein